MLAQQEPKYYGTPEGRLANRTTHETIPDDEPVFVLRAKDRHAVSALLAYMHSCAHPDHRTVIASRIKDFEAFAKKNPDRMKEPDSSMRDLAGADLGQR